jgi:hypothetical protein
MPSRQSQNPIAQTFLRVYFSSSYPRPGYRKAGTRITILDPQQKRSTPPSNSNRFPGTYFCQLFGQGQIRHLVSKFSLRSNPHSASRRSRARQTTSSNEDQPEQLERQRSRWAIVFLIHFESKGFEHKDVENVSTFLIFTECAAGMRCCCQGHNQSSEKGSNLNSAHRPSRSNSLAGSPRAKSHKFGLEACPIGSALRKRPLVGS